MELGVLGLRRGAGGGGLPCVQPLINFGGLLSGFYFGFGFFMVCFKDLICVYFSVGNDRRHYRLRHVSIIIIIFGITITITTTIITTITFTTTIIVIIIIMNYQQSSTTFVLMRCYITVFNVKVC